MASANEPGVLRIVAERADGLMKVAFQVRSDSPVNAGKSPDGVLANLTADKQLRIGPIGPMLTNGDKVHLFFKADAADGLDASDCVVQIPYWEDGNMKQLNATDIGFTTDFPAASTLANHWIELGTGYTIPANVQRAQLGNGHIVLSIEDDTG